MKDNKDKKYKVAVYGSLRKGLSNHPLLESVKAEYLGRFDTNPIFSMYSLGGYPGLKAGGSTSINMEVYEVDEKGLESVNQLEGYDPKSTNNDFYNRVTMSTPYGEAYTYIYVPNVRKEDFVDSGDWKDYYSTHSINKIMNII